MARSTALEMGLLGLILSGSLAFAGQAQTSSAISVETARSYFKEADSMCQMDQGRLWGASLCGPIMFVDPPSRFIVANQADADGALEAQNGVFVGKLPLAQNVANTAVVWSGVHWTQIQWPLPEDGNQRRTLIAHELFHRIQSQLKLPQLKGGDNQHLDSLDGRYYLQLEWRALAHALQDTTVAARKVAAVDAILFRAARYILFPQAMGQEQVLELNEGLAEYTGVKVGNSSPDEQMRAALRDLEVHTSDSTFVRSFAYATGPAYGLLLDMYAPSWRKLILIGERIDAVLQKALSINIPSNLQAAAKDSAQKYDGESLWASETEREAKRRQIIASYRAKFIDGTVLILPLRHMNVQFDPRSLQPLGDAVTVYPAMRITDDWGILDAKNGALMKSDWSAVIVSAPATMTASRAMDGLLN